MPRAKGGFKTRRRHKRVLSLAKGYWGAKSKLFRIATEAVDRALKFAYRDRRVRRREMRKLWIVRINAGARLNNMTYRELIHGLKLAEVSLDRKVLADMAVRDPQAFTRVIEVAREAVTVKV
jgi:large subunit ribosomal protein L20